MTSRVGPPPDHERTHDLIVAKDEVDNLGVLLPPKPLDVFVEDFAILFLGLCLVDADQTESEANAVANVIGSICASYKPCATLREVVSWAPLLLFLFLHLRLGDDLLQDVAGHDVVVAELDRVAAAAAGDARQAAGVGGHFGQGTSAMTVCRSPPAESMLSTRPRRPDMSLLMSPTLAVGTVTSIRTIGSSSEGLAC